MRLRLWVHFLALLMSQGIMGQITGVVQDDSDNSPIPNAIVSWEGTNISTLTDENGFYTIEKPSSSSYLSANALGYIGVSKSIISRSGEVSFKLSPENSELDEITVEGNARQTGIDINAATHRINIDRSELRKAACCNLSESFETNATVDVSFTDAVTGARQIEMLGLSGKYVLIQRENIPFARGINAVHGLTFIPGPFVESMQLTKGLSSVVNGYESISGQINIEFNKPNEVFDLSVNGYLNQGARAEANVWISTPLSPNVEMGTLVHYSSVPLAQDPNGDGFADMPIGDQFTLHNKWQYFLSDKWVGQIGFMINSDHRESGQLEDIFTPENNETPWMYNQQDNRYEIFGKSGYISPTRDSRSIGIVYGASYQEKEMIAGSRSISSNQNSFYLNAIYQDVIGNPFHSIKTGLSFQYDKVDEQYLLQDANVGYDYLREETVPGAFFEYTYLPSDTWTLVAGLRSDISSVFGLIVTPRINLKYEPVEGTTFRLGGGRGQRSVNFLNESSKGILSNRTYSFLSSSNQAEKAWNMGLSWTEDFLLFGRGASFSTDAFYTYFENKLLADFDLSPNVYAVYFAEGSSSISVLTQFDFSPAENLEIRIAYKYLDARDAFQNGTSASYGVPKHRSFLNAAYSIAKDWKVDATFNWFGPRRVLGTSYFPEEWQMDDFSPSFTTLNMQVTKTFGAHWELSVGVENLLNYRQDDPVLSSDDPSSIYFETNRVYGPIFGRMIYTSFYYNLN